MGRAFRTAAALVFSVGAGACMEPQQSFLGCEAYIDFSTETDWVWHSRLFGTPQRGVLTVESQNLYPIAYGELCELRGCNAGALLEVEVTPPEDGPFIVDGTTTAAWLYRSSGTCEPGPEPQPTGDWSVRFDIWDEGCIAGELLNLGPEFEDLEGKFYISSCETVN